MTLQLENKYLITFILVFVYSWFLVEPNKMQCIMAATLFLSALLSTLP